MVDDACVLDQLVTHTWGGSTVSGRRSTVAIVLYLATGFGAGGVVRVVWGLIAVVFVGLGVTLAIYRRRQTDVSTKTR